MKPDKFPGWWKSLCRGWSEGQMLLKVSNGDLSPSRGNSALYEPNSGLNRPLGHSYW